MDLLSRCLTPILSRFRDLCERSSYKLARRPRYSHHLQCARTLLCSPWACHRSLVSFFRALYMQRIAQTNSYSYFSLVFAATKTFPQYIGIASGTSMAVFGLSPLFLSLLASRFTPPGETLDIPAFFACMATLTGITHLGTSLIFRRAQKYFAIPLGADLTQEDTESLPALGSQSSEEDPLLGGDESDRDSAPKDPTDVHVSPVEEPQEGSTLDLFRDPYFWVLSLWMTIVVGVVCHTFMNLRYVLNDIHPGRDGRLQSRFDHPCTPLLRPRFDDRQCSTSSAPPRARKHTVPPRDRPNRRRTCTCRSAARRRRVGVRARTHDQPCRVHDRVSRPPRRDVCVARDHGALAGNGLAAQHRHRGRVRVCVHRAVRIPCPRCGHVYTRLRPLSGQASCPPFTA